MHSKTSVLLAVCVNWFVSVAVLGQFPADLYPENFDGRNGFTVTGVILGEFGNSVAGIGDVNADGVDDFASGGYGVLASEFCWLDPAVGAVHILFGRTDIGGDGLWSIDDLQLGSGFRIPGIDVGDGCCSVSSAGDFNNDGTADFLVGDYSADPFGIFAGGEAYLIYGGPD